MDQLLAMKVFTRVAERGSFAQAADGLDISRAAASAHVAALEKHLGVRLLNRTTRRVALTAEGADFLRRSRRILDEVQDAEETLRGSRSKPQGLLRVDVPVVFGRYLLLPALPEFTRRYPAIDLDIRLNDRVVDLLAERVDVALRVGPVQQAGLVARRVGQINIVTCASPTYLADHGEPATPEDLRQHRLLGLTSAAGLHELIAFHDLAASPRDALDLGRRHQRPRGRGVVGAGHRCERGHHDLGHVDGVGDGIEI
ncbi:MAG: LysR substrate-binding domain-containing protein, partial [Vicinamibacterales bacterium]